MKGERFLVTGASGFVGKQLAFELKKRGAEVITVSRRSVPEFTSRGIKHRSLDIGSDVKRLEELFEDIDGVFHVAAKVDMWGAAREFYHCNVLATHNVIHACKSNGVKRLVFTSSPSVIASGKDLRGVDEGEPYPDSYLALYPMTKAMAEREVLASNSDMLRTLSLRPHLIWGPGDTNLVPTILKRARQGKLVRVGAGKNKVDLCYIDDCVEAHILAMQALAINPNASGQAYFITQGDPVFLWQWIDEVLVRHGVPQIRRTLSKGVAYRLASALEVVAKITGREPRFTRFLVSEMATDHYFDISRARSQLGFKPRFTVAEALDQAFPSERDMARHEIAEQQNRRSVAGLK